MTFVKQGVVQTLLPVICGAGGTEHHGQIAGMIGENWVAGSIRPHVTVNVITGGALVELMVNPPVARRTSNLQVSKGCDLNTLSNWWMFITVIFLSLLLRPVRYLNLKKSPSGKWHNGDWRRRLASFHTIEHVLTWYFSLHYLFLINDEVKRTK